MTFNFFAPSFLTEILQFVRNFDFKKVGNI